MTGYKPITNMLSQWHSLPTGRNLKYLEDYGCPMWKLYEGTFDTSEYEIDHIEEYSLTKNNNIDYCWDNHSNSNSSFYKS